MLQYNTQKDKVLLTEYGRNIQKLVAHAKNIEDDEVRNEAAKQIVKAMEILNPKIRKIQDYKKILWSHLALISNYELDIDYPYEIIKKEKHESKPAPIKYRESPIKYKHFGRTIEKLIEKVSDIENKELKEKFVKHITNHMKKTYLTWNKEVVQDEVIFESLEKLSNGKLKPEEGFTLPRAREIKSKTRKRINRHRK